MEFLNRCAFNVAAWSYCLQRIGDLSFGPSLFRMKHILTSTGMDLDSRKDDHGYNRNFSLDLDVPLAIEAAST